ncbi:MAG: hypothetical protein ACOCQ4_00760 [bacterium]
MRTKKDLISLLNKIEKELITPKWKINNLDIWPLFRHHIAWQWLDKYGNKQTRKNQEQRIVKKNLKGYILRIKKTLYSLKKTKNLFFNELDYIFIGSEAYRSTINGINMNRFFDPLMDDLEKHENARLIYLEHGSKAEKKYRQDRRIDFIKFIEGYEWIYKRVFSSKKNFNFSQTQIKDLNKTIEKEGLKLKINDLEINFNKQRFLNYFAKALKKKNKKLKAIFFLCYYNSFDLIYAFNQAGIKTIDFQHGPTTELHPMYGSWQNIPPYGLNTLPSHFWCWEKNSVKAINKWSQNINNHKAFIGGHTWINYCKSIATKEIKPKTKRILFSLQPFENPFPDWIWPILRNIQYKYEILFRLHPRMKVNQETIKLLSEKNGLVNPNIKEATETPLPLLLTSISIHITRSSGVSIEASFFNIPTLFIDCSGKDYYPEIIQNNMGKLVDEDNMVEMIEYFIKKEKPTHIDLPKINYSKIIEKEILS